jgi:hypothetical protein
MLLHPNPEDTSWFGRKDQLPRVVCDRPDFMIVDGRAANVLTDGSAS